MVEDENIMKLRLLLCARTLNLLEIGTEILGIETLEEM
jgi:arginyl-tRNA synthetase